MKVVVSAFLLLAWITGVGQRVALLHKDFEKPIIYTDSVTAEQMTDYFPVEIKDFDTLHASLRELSKMLRTRQRSKFESFEYRAGSTILKTTKQTKTHGDAFFVTAITKVDEIQSVYSLTKKSNNNASNARRLDKILSYISTNKSLFKSPYTVSPKYYNVVIVKEQ